jgi:hypothetical protein
VNFSARCKKLGGLLALRDLARRHAASRAFREINKLW